jgi:hypothetical protein
MVSSLFNSKRLPGSPKQHNTMTRRVVHGNATTQSQQCHESKMNLKNPICIEPKVMSPQMRIHFRSPHFPCDSSDSSSDSSMTTSSSSTSRRKRRRCRQLQLRKRIKDRIKIQSMIDQGYSLQYGSFEDDRSVSSLSGDDTDYSVSEGSVKFNGLGNSHHRTDGGPIVGKENQLER